MASFQSVDRASLMLTLKLTITLILTLTLFPNPKIITLVTKVHFQFSRHPQKNGKC